LGAIAAVRRVESVLLAGGGSKGLDGAAEEGCAGAWADGAGVAGTILSGAGLTEGLGTGEGAEVPGVAGGAASGLTGAEDVGPGVAGNIGSLRGAGLAGSELCRATVLGGALGEGSNQFKRYGRETTTMIASTVSTSTARNQPAAKMLRGAYSCALPLRETRLDQGPREDPPPMFG